MEGGDTVGVGEDGVVGGGDDHAAFGWGDGEVGNFEGAHVLEALIREVGLAGGAVEDLCGVEAGDGELVEFGPLGGDVAWGVGEGVEAAEAGEFEGAMVEEGGCEHGLSLLITSLNGDGQSDDEAVQANSRFSAFGVLSEIFILSYLK